MPIVMAMIAGAMIRFGVGAVNSVSAAPLIAGSAAIAFFVTMRFTKRFPPVLAALLVGLIAAIATGSIQTATVNIDFVAPEFTTPVFTVITSYSIHYTKLYETRSDGLAA